MINWTPKINYDLAFSYFDYYIDLSRCSFNLTWKISARQQARTPEKRRCGTIPRACTKLARKNKTARSCEESTRSSTLTATCESSPTGTRAPVSTSTSSVDDCETTSTQDSRLTKIKGGRGQGGTGTSLWERTSCKIPRPRLHWMRTWLFKKRYRRLMPGFMNNCQTTRAWRTPLVKRTIVEPTLTRISNTTALILSPTYL